MRFLSSTSLALVLLISASALAQGSTGDIVSQIETPDFQIKLVKPNHVDDYLKELYLEAGNVENGKNLCETLNIKNYEVIYNETQARLGDLAKFSSNFVSFYREKLRQSQIQKPFPANPIEIVIRPTCLVTVGGNIFGIDGTAFFDKNRIVFRLETSENEVSSHYRNSVANNTPVLAHELGHLLHFSLGIDYTPINEAIADFFAYLYTGKSFVGFYPLSKGGYGHIRDFQITSLKDLKKMKAGKYSFIIDDSQGIQAGHLIGAPVRDALIRVSQKYSPQQAFDVVVRIGNAASSKQLDMRAKQISDPARRQEFLEQQYREIISAELQDYEF